MGGQRGGNGGAEGKLGVRWGRRQLRAVASYAAVVGSLRAASGVSTFYYLFDQHVQQILDN